MTNSSQALSFSGHETFVLRYGWLKKAYDAVVSDPEVFQREDALVTLGVGKNMVRSIRHWALACKIIEEQPRSRGSKFAPTPLAAFLFGENGRDRYLEDLGSLWLIHWNLVRHEAKATTWAWAFNLLRSTEFVSDTLRDLIVDEVNRRGSMLPSADTLKRDVDCFVRTYVPARQPRKALLEDTLDSPLCELGILQYDQTLHVYRFNRGSQDSLPDSLFTYALLSFWNASASHRESLSLNEIAFAPFSPGAVFKIDEENLIERLERVHDLTKARLLYTDTAGLKQVFRKGVLGEQEFLDLHYAAQMVV